MLVKELGRSTNPPAAGSWALGLSRVQRSLKFLGISTNGLHVVDGSGLDVSNRVTCRALLQTVQSHGDTSAFFAGLPVMGQTGTLRKRLRNTAATGSVHAKTGTLNGVSSLAGVATTSAGANVEFAIVFNGLSSTAVGVAAADAVVEAIVSFPEAPAVRELRPVGSASAPNTSPATGS